MLIIQIKSTLRALLHSNTQLLILSYFGMRDNLPIYNMILDEETGDSFKAISFVDDPANMQDFVLMSSDTEKESEIIDDVKGIVTGAVLIPEQLIYRNINGAEFYMRFSTETIEAMAMQYMRDNDGYFSVDHEYGSYGNFIFESWIKTTDEDKSNGLGFDLPIGTWFISVKVEDVAVLAKLKEGGLKGFSIEALLSRIAVSMNKENETEETLDSVLSEIEKELNKLID